MNQENDSQMAESENESQASAGATEDKLDYKALYLKEIENSKKQRSGKQSAANENESLKAQIAKYEEEKLIAEGKQAEVIEKLKMDNKDLLQYKDKYNSYLADEKQSILDQFPEEDREELAGKDLDTLKYIQKKTLNKKPQGNHIPSIPSMVKTSKEASKDWTAMTDQERRDNWVDIVNNFKNRGS
tara:strand:- start:3212 stop:3769 length:558 start_codon:yes stop_codon:yes gene_type:complete